MLDSPNNDVIPVLRDIEGSGLKKQISIPVIIVNGINAGISL